MNYANQTAPEVRPDAEGDTTASRLADRSSELSQLVSRLERLGDRLLGGSPKPIGKDGEAMPAGMPPLASRLRMTDDAFGMGLKALSEQISRLETFI